MKKILGSTASTVALVGFLGLSVLGGENSLEDAILREAVFCDVIDLAGQEHAVLVVHCDKTRPIPVMVGEGLPLEVWTCPILKGLLDPKQARRIGDLPQSIDFPGGQVLGCLQGKRYVFVYETLWESGRYLATKSFLLGAAPDNAKPKPKHIRVKRVVDGVEVEIDTIQGTGPDPPKVVYLEWCETEGGGDVDNVRLLRLFVGKDGCLNLVGQESEGKKRLFITRKTTTGGWQKCQRFNSVTPRVKKSSGSENRD